MADLLGSEGFGTALSFKPDMGILKMDMANQAMQAKAAAKQQEQDNAYMDKINQLTKIDYKEFHPSQIPDVTADNHRTVTQLLNNMKQYPNGYRAMNDRILSDYQERLGDKLLTAKNRYEFQDSKNYQYYDDATKSAAAKVASAVSEDDINGIAPTDLDIYTKSPKGTFGLKMVNPKIDINDVLNKTVNNPENKISQVIGANNLGVATDYLSKLSVPKDGNDLIAVKGYLKKNFPNIPDDQLDKLRSADELAKELWEHDANVRNAYYINKINSDRGFFDDAKGKRLDGNTAMEKLKNDFVAKGSAMVGTSLKNQLEKNPVGGGSGDGDGSGHYWYDENGHAVVKEGKNTPPTNNLGKYAPTLHTINDDGTMGETIAERGFDKKDGYGIVSGTMTLKNNDGTNSATQKQVVNSNAFFDRDAFDKSTVGKGILKKLKDVRDRDIEWGMDKKLSNDIYNANVNRIYADIEDNKERQMLWEKGMGKVKDDGGDKKLGNLKPTGDL